MPLIRPATALDAPAIAHVHVQSWRSTYAGIVPSPFLAALNEADRASQWTGWLQLDLPVYVAEVSSQTDSQIVGFIGGGPIRESVPGFDAELFALYLLKPAQRQGIGTALLHALARALTQRGLTSMVAWVLVSNSSRYFYERTGARLVQTSEIEIGKALLPIHAYGWPSLTALLENRGRCKTL